MRTLYVWLILIYALMWRVYDILEYDPIDLKMTFWSQRRPTPSDRSCQFPITSITLTY